MNPFWLWMVGEMVWTIIRFIIPRALAQLEEGGLLAFEIGHTQAAAVVTLIESCLDYQDIQVVQDYSGYDRVVLARKRTLNG